MPKQHKHKVHTHTHVVRAKSERAGRDVGAEAQQKHQTVKQYSYIFHMKYSQHYSGIRQRV